MSGSFHGVNVQGNFNAGLVGGDMVSIIHSGGESRSSSEASEATAPWIFVSHSHADAQLVGDLVGVILRAMPNLMWDQIRSSSNPALSMPSGSRLEEGIFREVRLAKVVLGVLTPNSLVSTYVQAELGLGFEARKLLLGWVGIDPERSGLYRNTVQRSLVEQDAVRKLILDIAVRLGSAPAAPEVWSDEVVAVTARATLYR